MIDIPCQTEYVTTTLLEEEVVRNLLSPCHSWLSRKRFLHSIPVSLQDLTSSQPRTLLLSNFPHEMHSFVKGSGNIHGRKVPFYESRHDVVIPSRKSQCRWWVKFWPSKTSFKHFLSWSLFASRREETFYLWRCNHWAFRVGGWIWFFPSHAKKFPSMKSSRGVQRQNCMYVQCLLYRTHMGQMESQTTRLKDHDSRLR